MSKKIDIENTENEHFFIGKHAHDKQVVYGGRKLTKHYYHVTCKRCGDGAVVLKGFLLGNRTRSCGCLKRVSGADHQSWRGIGELSAELISDIERSAHTRGLSFELSPEFLWGLLQRQNHCCALTGIPLIARRKSHRLGNASLDRIENDKGYDEDNVRWVCVDANLMKRTMTDAQLLYFCRRVVLTIGEGSLEQEEIPDLDTTRTRRTPRKNGVNKRKNNAKAVKPSRWWENKNT